jgi:hypothetical protein
MRDSFVVSVVIVYNPRQKNVFRTGIREKNRTKIGNTKYPKFERKRLRRPKALMCCIQLYRSDEKSSKKKQANTCHLVSQLAL